jgi:hypothetical protein
MSINLIKRGSIWHMRGTVARQLVRESTYTSDKALAEVIAANTEARIIRESVYGPEHETTFADAALKYLNAGKPATRYIRALIEALGKRRLSMIKPGDIKQLALDLYPNAKGSTRNTSVIRPAVAIINFAAELGLCHHVRVKAFPQAKTIRHPVDRAWIDAFRAVAPFRLGALAVLIL